MAVIIKQVAEASKESQHSADLEHILLHGDRVYTCADDGMVKIWSKDLKFEREFQAHDYAIYNLLVFNGKLLTASNDATIKVWNLETLELEQTLKDHEEPVRKLATSGNKVYSGDEAGHVHRWCLSSTLELDAKYEVSEEIWDLQAQDQYFVTVRDRGLSITETHDDKTSKYTVSKSIQGRAPLYLSQHHLVFAQFGGDFGLHVHKYQPNDFPKVADVQGHEKIITCLDGYTQAGGTEQIVSGGYDNKVKLWALPSGALVAQCDIAVTPSTLAMDDAAVYVGGPDGYLVKLQVS